MPHDFDRMIDRSGTDALKWSVRRQFTGVPDVLPMWVADMDFETAPAVRRAVLERAEHGIFGYPVRPDSYNRAVVGWMKRRFGWEIRKGWIAFTPGVVPAVHFAVQAFSHPGDKVVLQPPVYHPFKRAVENNGRRCLLNPLKIENGRYIMDLEGLEQAVDGRTRMLILCSPHNPVGRVWTREELEGLADICLRNQILIISDEIHADLVLKGHRHTPTATLSPEIADITVTCTSPNKTFNIAGLGMANNVISNRFLRDRFQNAVSAAGIGLANLFGIAATEAAYNGGEAWLEDLLEYLESNFEFLKNRMGERLPGIKVFPLEGTFLAWLDFREFDLNDKQLKDLLLKKGKIWLDEGPKFGVGGEGFQRINIACPRTVLEDGIERIAKALADL